MLIRQFVTVAFIVVVCDDHCQILLLFLLIVQRLRQSTMQLREEIAICERANKRGSDDTGAMRRSVAHNSRDNQSNNTCKCIALTSASESDSITASYAEWHTRGCCARSKKLFRTNITSRVNEICSDWPHGSDGGPQTGLFTFRLLLMVHSTSLVSWCLCK